MKELAFLRETQQVRSDDSNRKLVLVAHALILAGLLAAQLPAIGAVIIAYTQRNRVHDTIWEAHYGAIITTFWIGLIFYLVSIPLIVTIIGVPIAIAMIVWVLYRGIRGLVHAAKNKPY